MYPSMVLVRYRMYAAATSRPTSHGIFGAVAFTSFANAGPVVVSQPLNAALFDLLERTPSLSARY
jgi:hypothetical protein